MKDEIYYNLLATLKETRKEPGLELDRIADAIKESFDTAERNYLVKKLLEVKLIPLCELCNYDYNDESFSKEELQTEIDSVKENGRCVSCFDEYGETGYPDREI